MWVFVYLFVCCCCFSFSVLRLHVKYFVDERVVEPILSEEQLRVFTLPVFININLLDLLYLHEKHA